ncbi:MAG: exodeoxyribonuclease III [Bacteroidales bacterium]
MKIVSWNVNGIRAVLKKDFYRSVKEMDADILCLQETKIHVPLDIPGLPQYRSYWNGAQRKGYSGTAIFTKTEPLKVTRGIGIEAHDGEGRVITAEYGDFYLVNAYIPNSGRGLVRLPYREEWDRDFLDYLHSLQKRKPLILCGDMNVAHREIDLKNPKSNYDKTAGYTQREIDGMNKLQEVFVDTFRALYPDEMKYTWWSYMFSAREKNIGWRIDYFLISQSLRDKLQDAFILNEIAGSDHCPVGVEMKL